MCVKELLLFVIIFRGMIFLAITLSRMLYLFYYTNIDPFFYTSFSSNHEALQGVRGNMGKGYLFQGNRGTKAKF